MHGIVDLLVLCARVSSSPWNFLHLFCVEQCLYVIVMNEGMAWGILKGMKSHSNPACFRQQEGCNIFEYCVIVCQCLFYFSVPSRREYVQGHGKKESSALYSVPCPLCGVGLVLRKAPCPSHATTGYGHAAAFRLLTRQGSNKHSAYLQQVVINLF